VGGEIELFAESGADDIEGDTVDAEAQATRLTVSARQVSRRRRSMTFLRSISPLLQRPMTPAVALMGKEPAEPKR
jgi:hypothetical protein